MPFIKSVLAREILDSRGIPTIETEIALDSGDIGVASVPSGASTGSFEAVELRDGGKRFLGKGVLTAVDNVNNIIALDIIGEMSIEQYEIDKIMIDLDGTPNKSKLGANAILSASLAVCKAAALFYGVPLHKYIGGIANRRLPRPMMNILNGGAHADNKIDCQEFMIVPAKEAKFMSYIEMCSNIYHTLKKSLKAKGLNSNVGDEGGVAPNLSSTREALDTIMEAIEAAGYNSGSDVEIALDVAASELFKDGKYMIEGTTKTSEQMIEFYKNLVKDYPIVSIEDPLHEEDWTNFSLLTKEIGNTTQIVGDDLYVTNSSRLQKGIELQATNAILIKLNQIGTVSETLATINLAKESGYNVVISHRSGETEDTTISDLSVAVGAKYIKTGAPTRGERITKYNRLLKIEEEI
ncbi:MAG: phosphopyruvate hydratase [Holosporales bacterium]|jgi:enolase|nr:phosphopyruvate hydratase [Holosporales bacterium]